MSVVGALFYGLANLLHPRMLWLMLWPMLVALAFWGALALAFGGRLTAALSALFQRWLEPAAGFMRLDFADVTVIAAYVVLFLLIVPLVYLTALFILGIFGEYFARDGTFLHDLSTHVSVWAQMNDFASGVIDTRRLVFSGTLVVVPLFAAVRVLEASRWA